MTRNATLFREVGQAIYGPAHWHAALADRLDVSSRSVRRWGSGEFSVPEGVWRDLVAICRERSKTLAKLAALLECPPQT